MSFEFLFLKGCRFLIGCSINFKKLGVKNIFATMKPVWGKLLRTSIQVGNLVYLLIWIIIKTKRNVAICWISKKLIFKILTAINYLMTMLRNFLCFFTLLFLLAQFCWIFIGAQLMRILVSPQNIFSQFIVNKRKKNITFFLFLSLTRKWKILTKKVAFLVSVNFIKVPEVNVFSI